MIKASEKYTDQGRPIIFFATKCCSGQKNKTKDECMTIWLGLRSWLIRIT